MKKACGWQFKSLLTEGKAICFEADNVIFAPIIEVASTHKSAIRQAVLFEYQSLRGRLLVCSLYFSDRDPAAAWLKGQIMDYVKSPDFAPKEIMHEQTLQDLINGNVMESMTDTNRAANLNDIAATKCKR